MSKLMNSTGWEDKQASVETLRRDIDMSIGVAAGYLNLTASLMG